jgi:hypothetical protein
MGGGGQGEGGMWANIILWNFPGGCEPVPRGEGG